MSILLRTNDKIMPTLESAREAEGGVSSLTDVARRLILAGAEAQGIKVNVKKGRRNTHGKPRGGRGGSRAKCEPASSSAGS